MSEQRSAHPFAATASATAVLLGSSVLLGWIFDIAVLKSLLPSLQAMHVFTAVSFVLAGISLKLRLEQNPSEGRTRVANACALLILGIGALVLGEYAFDVDLVFDRFTFHSSEVAGVFVERMAPNTALTFSLLSAALLLMDRPSQALRTISQVLLIVVLLVAFIATTGYVLSSDVLYGVPGYQAMALHTAIGVAVLSSGVLVARPRRGVIAILLQDNPGGAAARRALPVFIVTLVATGWLRLKGQEAGLYGTELGLAVMIAVCSSIFAAVVLWNARVQGRDEKRWQETVWLIEAIKDYAIFMLDKTGKVVTWNAGAERLTGYAAEKIIGQPFSCLEPAPDVTASIPVYLADDDAPGMPARQLEIAGRDERYEDEAWLLREDGSTFLANRVITALRNDRRELVGFAQITRDITERTQVAEQNLLSTLHQHTLVSVADRRGRITDVNPAFCAISGYTRDELLGQDHRISNSGAHSREFWKDFWRSLEAGKPWRGEICNRAKDGSLYWVDSIVAPFFDHDGRIAKYVTIRLDITAHKEAQRRLTDSELFLERVEKVSRVGGFTIDLSSGLQRWTRQSYGIHELEEGRVPTAELVNTFLTPEARSAMRDALRIARAHGTGFDIEVPIVTAKGRPIWVRAAGEVESDRGVPVRVVGAVQDITERRAMEQRLRDATAAAQKANDAKSQFLAHMSHEIRTPLNVVIGLGYLLEQTSLHDDQRQLLTKIQFAGRALLGVINNVLDLSKVEAGAMSLEDEPFDLPALVRELGSMLAPHAVAKGINLIVMPSAELPRFVRGDASRLRQVFMNLLNNAIKFTNGGHVALKVSCTEQTSERFRLRCEVEDTGIGIEPAAIERLFTPFTQADASTTRRFGGTGLGLSIARGFVELMGGEIGVTSVPGVGTTFWTEIPLRIASRFDGADNADVAGSTPRVFIADLTSDSPKGLALMVRALGWDARVFESGEQLLGILKTTHSDAWPDVLILQLRLRDTDPQELIASFQKACPLGRLPPVIVVAELEASAGEREPLTRAGDVMLESPLAGSALFNAINAALASRYDDRKFALQSVNLDEAQAQWLSGVRVLVVDDSDLNLEVAQRILEKQGAIVTTCLDGGAAVEHVRAHHQGLDVILMDVQMPVLDGNQATRRIRGELNLRTLPIVALTAGALLDERQRSLEAGMNDFITKPFEPQVLVRKVRRLVEQARGEPIPMAYLDEKSAGRSAETVFMPSIDAGVVQAMFGDDVILFRSLLARFLKEHADLCTPISASLIDKPMRIGLEARTHKLRGSAGLIGASNVMRLAAAAEAALQEDRPSEVVQKILERLGAMLTLLREEADVWLKKQPESDPPAGTKAAQGQGIDAVDTAELCMLLESQNLAAMDKFTTLSPALREILAAEAFDRLSEAIDNLDFGLGAELLHKALPDNAAVSLRIGTK